MIAALREFCLFQIAVSNKYLNETAYLLPKKKNKKTNKQIK
jgi:hypothetical protein